ncbi:hypothetical protein DEDE109153_00685 [Deinococcus deserti]|uniref:Uncharacterized protein n=1 Tax=Deinococcus deserti (strain DSM 17065 / CIP 109153 / LMG 22923 / VCD115) TaxID=546414 RepID=C1CVV0_DEIDV|nr:hypothetical protein [Deinococcus deserti]ACO46317.1 hypothetical protein Deide_13760 [Deinococcus deserti VCD115]
MTYWTELVELYEYKVTDLLEGRSPRGGRRSLGALRDDLLSAPLTPPQLRRLMEADRRYRALLKGQHAAPQTSSGERPASRPGWAVNGTAVSEAARASNDLQRLAWHAGVRRELLEESRAWQQEPSLVTLRVAYAALENAERAAGTGHDWQVVPEVHDPLSSLYDTEVIHRLMYGMADLMLAPEGRTRLRTELLKIHEEPFRRHADEDVLAARLEAVGREPLSEPAREALRQALRAQYPPPRDPRERPAIRDAAQRLLTLLQELVARAPALVPGRLPPHVLLYAKEPSLAQDRPDDASDKLFVYMPGGTGAQWRGLTLRWQPVSTTWQLQVDGQLIQLRPDAPDIERSALLTTSRGDLRAFISGPYLLLRAEGSTREALNSQATLARAVAFLMRPAGGFAALRLARGAILSLRHQALDLESLGPMSVTKYAQAAPSTLLEVARRGAETLVSRVAELTPEEIARHLQGAAGALALDMTLAAGLHEVLHRAAFPDEVLPEPVIAALLEVSCDGAFRCVRLGDDPLTLHVADRLMTVRLDYKGDRLAVLPGQPPVVVSDLVVIAVPGLRVMLVRQLDWLAVAAEVDPPGSETDLTTLIADEF